jgi:membrane fusion protein (multidrug efflux system)
MTDETKETNGNATEKRKMRRRRRIVMPLLLLACAAALVAGYWHLYLRGYVSTDDAYIDSDAITVSSKMLGRINRLGADEGDAVTAGQLLAQLIDSDLQAQEAQAKANLEYVEQNVSVAKINVDRAQEDFDRASYQYSNKVVPREQFDHARAALELARAQYKVAQSQVNASKAQLNVIETQLGNTMILAPRSGVVARKWVVAGDVVQPGQPIFTLFDLGDIWVTANFEETKLGSIHVGDHVRISVDAHRGRELAGAVRLIGAAAASQFSLIPPNNASGNFTKVTQRIPITISIDFQPGDDPEGRIALLPGMSVEVKIRVKGK